MTKASLQIDDEISVKEIQDLYDNVVKFYEERNSPPINIIWLSNLILKRLMQDKDFFANCEGQTGNGKSNFILLLSLLQCRFAGIWRNKKTGKMVKVLPRLKPLPEPWEHIKFGFSFKRNISFLDDAETIKKHFNALDQYHPYILDEGVKALHKYEWNTKLQMILVRLSTTERYQNKSVFVCFPNFKELNSAFRNDRIAMRIYLYDRNKVKGYSSCILSLKDVNRYVTDPYHTEENAKMFEYLLRRVPAALRGPSQILYAEKRLAGFAGNFDIPSLERIAPRIWNIYVKYKIFNAQQDQENNLLNMDEETSERVKKAKALLTKSILFIKKIQPNIKDDIIYTALDISKRTYQNLMRETNTSIANKDSNSEKAS